MTLGLSAQSERKVNFALESNALSWLSGHAGPNLRFVTSYHKFHWYAGFTYSYFSPYKIAGKPESDLRFYQQDFSRGFDGMIGFRGVWNRHSIGQFFQYGRYTYDCSRLICTGGIPIIETDIFGNSYVRCAGVATNEFKEHSYRFGIGAEYLFKLYDKNNFSLSVGITEQLNFLISEYEGFIETIDRHGLQTGVHVTKPEIHDRTDRFLLEDIPLNNIQWAEEGDYRIRIAFKLLFIVRYTL